MGKQHDSYVEILKTDLDLLVKFMRHERRTDGEILGVIAEAVSSKIAELGLDQYMEYHCYSCGKTLHLKENAYRICTCGSDKIYAV